MTRFLRFLETMIRGIASHAHRHANQVFRGRCDPRLEDKSWHRFFEEALPQFLVEDYARVSTARPVGRNQSGEK
jgi:hypothetical protein